MKFLAVAALASLAHIASAVGVVGTAEGFATGVTGGGSATPQYPKDIKELTAWLTDATPRVIVLDKTFDYTTSEGTVTGTACANWGTGAACQRILLDTCDAGKVKETVTYYKAAKQGIKVASNKTLLGIGNKGIIKGKGLSFASKNVIVQNIQVSDLNHKYVWGGDALSFAGADLIWIDHVTTARPGRQHYVFGFTPSTRITLSSNFINGLSDYSTGCDGYHYWTMEMVGTGDTITMKNNYITKTGGRGPALSGKTLLHAVNNVWADVKGHVLEGGDTGARGIFEGNVFKDVRTVVADYQGKLFGSPDASTNNQCTNAFGRACQVNLFQGTTTTGSVLTSKKDTSFFSEFKGKTNASAKPASEIVTRVPNGAGNGKLSALASRHVSAKFRV
ncbi:pectin lyase fold/virulence factor [Boeremia exigua]|uniref:pectin lyase fold/virulence factor n=1 Tax=Boeremia exigua TaxID=749465 RepID=UPI001E8E3B21|nr:pectin lyase fold/virulence factor [Boeremia exigua]KAH6633506.1 pectin lyase fold/virulence factor [Boeremia exigua]